MQVSLKYPGRLTHPFSAILLIHFSATLEFNVRNIKANAFDLRIHMTQQNHFVLVMRWNFGGILDFQAG